ncbi:MAG: hypothetical protein RLZZ628_4070 [Bacteroidota bacterium]|jgi:hypothetical protein
MKIVYCGLESDDAYQKLLRYGQANKHETYLSAVGKDQSMLILEGDNLVCVVPKGPFQMEFLDKTLRMGRTSVIPDKFDTAAFVLRGVIMGFSAWCVGKFLNK